MIGGPTDDGASAQVYYKIIKNKALTIPNLEFMGFLPYAETEPHFDNAGVFVNTSDVEGFPNTFLQAWARGIPTVSFFDAALSSLGVYRHVSGVEDAVRTTRELMQDDDKWNACSMCCKVYVKQHHATSVVMASYERLFASLIRGPQGIS
jgi:glycosyltransferase involved in cell wall biosynthesis